MPLDTIYIQKVTTKVFECKQMLVTVSAGRPNRYVTDRSPEYFNRLNNCPYLFNYIYNPQYGDCTPDKIMI